MSADHLSDGSIGAMPLGGVAPAGLCQALHEVDLFLLDERVSRWSLYLRPSFAWRRVVQSTLWSDLMRKRSRRASSSS